MAYAIAAMAAISAYGAYSSAESASAQNETQNAWNEYNTLMNDRVNRDNLSTQAELSFFNAQQVIDSAEYGIAIDEQSIAYNTSLIAATTEYNNSLLEEEEARMWEANDLDLKVLEQQRARERGQMVGNMAASGIDINTGSNVNLVVDQMTQEAMDSFVLTHNAELNAMDIQNTMAKNVYEGELAIQQMNWEGELSAALSRQNANTQAQSITANGMASYYSGMQSADYQVASGANNAEISSWTNSMQINNQLTQGLTQTAGSSISQGISQMS